MFDRILIAVDGSECAGRAARVGYQVAATCGAAVDLLLAVDPGSAAVDDDPSEAAEAILEETAALADGLGIEVATHLVEGKPYSAILESADREGADLIVMGREGRGGLLERMLGSTTDRVLRRATVPVLAVPDGDRGPVEPVEELLVTTDGSNVAEVAGPVAADLAVAFDATLHVLSVADVQASAGLFDAGGVSTAYVERLEAQAREAVDRLEGRITDRDLRPTSSVRRGIAHEEIAAYVASAGIDLVVLSSAGQSNLGGQHLGSTTGRVLGTVDVPVLVATPTDDPAGASTD